MPSIPGRGSTHMPIGSTQQRWAREAEARVQQPPAILVTSPLLNGGRFVSGAGNSTGQNHGAKSRRRASRGQQSSAENPTYFNQGAGGMGRAFLPAREIETAWINCTLLPINGNWLF